MTENKGAARGNATLGPDSQFVALRVPRNMHDRLKIIARRRGLSVNAHIITLIERAGEEDKAPV